MRTVCHPDKDMIGVSIESELLNDGNMSIYLDFPYPDGRYFKHYIGRYDTISGHTSTFEKLAPNSVRITRTMDDTHYYATVNLKRRIPSSSSPGILPPFPLPAASLLNRSPM